MANRLEIVQDPKLKRLKADFISDFQAEKSWREDKEEFGNFYDGDQLSEEEKKALEDRGQPPVVINRIKPKLDAIFGIQEALTVDTKCYPIGDKENEATVISEELRHIEDDSDFDLQESMAFEDQVIDGRGWYKISKEFDGLDGVDKVKYVDNENVVIDKYCSREDLKTGELRTAKRLHETIWLDYEDAIETFPKFKEQIEIAIARPELSAPMLSEKLKEFNPDQYRQQGDTTGVSDPDLAEFSAFVDKKRKRIRLVNTFYRTPVVTKYLKHSGGTVDITEMDESQVKKMTNELEGATTWTETRYSLNSCIFAWNVILEEKKDIRPYDKMGKFPLILVPAYVTRGKEKKHYGLVKQQMDPQREVNKRRSKMLHLLNVNQTWFEEGAFENELVARKEVAKPDGWIKYRKEFKVEPVRHSELAASQFQLLQESKNEVDSSGVNKEIEGRSSATSGREFQLRQQQSMQSIRKLFVNLRAARKRVAAYLLDEILYRNPDLLKDVRKYDLILDEAPETTNLMSETFDTLASLAKGGIQIPVEMLIEASPLSANKKKEFLERMAQQQMQQQQMMAMQAGLPPQQ